MSRVRQIDTARWLVDDPKNVPLVGAVNRGKLSDYGKQLYDAAHPPRIRTGELIAKKLFKIFGWEFYTAFLKEQR